MTHKLTAMYRLVRSFALILLVIGVLLPLVPQLLWSFAFGWFFPALLPQRWELQAWRYLFSTSSRVGEALLTSVALAVVVVMLTVLIGLPAGRALGLHQFRGKRLVNWLMTAPLFVPTLVVIMGIHILFIRYGLADQFLGVVLVHLIPALPYFVLVISSVFANYATELEDTARTLGAGPLRTLRYVTLPLIFPGLLVAMLFTFLVSWSQYITTVLIGGGRVVTLPMVLFPFISAANHTNAAAVSIVFILPALLILALTSRTLSTGADAIGGLG
ncbi:MAG: ABC transporter permease subunit, partial [Caldilineaceae bacterium]|nr:ABC transporter permease subunit [Caldilineaceae bacterium]